MKKQIIVLILACFLLSGCFANSDYDVHYVGKDIKEDYCGEVVETAYCQCANHGEMCDEAGVTQAEAQAGLESGFDTWSEEDIAVFEADCESNDGKFVRYGSEDPSCTYCNAGFIWDDEEKSSCVNK